jgi:hypothetical protein
MMSFPMRWLLIDVAHSLEGLLQMPPQEFDGIQGRTMRQVEDEKDVVLAAKGKEVLGLVESAVVEEEDHDFPVVVAPEIPF